MKKIWKRLLIGTGIAACLAGAGLYWYLNIYDNSKNIYYVKTQPRTEYIANKVSVTNENDLQEIVFGLFDSESKRTKIQSKTSGFESESYGWIPGDNWVDVTVRKQFNDYWIDVTLHVHHLDDARQRHVPMSITTSNNMSIIAPKTILSVEHELFVWDDTVTYDSPAILYFNNGQETMKVPIRILAKIKSISLVLLEFVMDQPENAVEYLKIDRHFIPMELRD
jgi:hypothetical protein